MEITREQQLAEFTHAIGNDYSAYWGGSDKEQADTQAVIDSLILKYGEEVYLEARTAYNNKISGKSA